MGEKKYMMADVAEKLDLPPHTLRYYEDSLSINIPRNERGLRYYRKQEIELFRSVSNLTKKGFELPAIKLILEDIHRIEKLPPEKLLELRDKLDVVMGNRSIEQDEDMISQVGMRIGSQNGYHRSAVPATISAGNTFVKVVENGYEVNSENKMVQFKNIMTGIMLDALRINNNELGKQLKYEVTDSVVKEVGFLISNQNDEQEARFKSIDEKLREVCATAERTKERKKETKKGV